MSYRLKMPDEYFYQTDNKYGMNVMNVVLGGQFLMVFICVALFGWLYGLGVWSAIFVASWCALLKAFENSYYDDVAYHWDRK